MLSQLERSIPGSKVLIHEEMPIMLLSMPLMNKLKNDLIYICRKWHLKCGISMPFQDWKYLNVYYHQAAKVLSLAGDDTTLHFCMDHAIHFLLEDVGNSITASHMRHPAVSVLAEYDMNNNTELLRTLHTYLLCERNSTLTSKTLHIHRNTLQYRIHKIQDLINTDLEDPDERLHLLLSSLYHLHIA